MNGRGLGCEARCWGCIIILLVLATIASLCYLLALPFKDRAELKKARKLPHPQYTLLDAALSPNASVDTYEGENRLTADFSYTLKAYNDPKIKNKTILYDNSSAAQVTLYYLVGVNYGKGGHREDPMAFASSSSVMAGPSTLSPLSSAVFTINVHVQNLPLPYKNDDAATGAPNYTMVLNVDYQAGFDDDEKESKYHKVSVRCDGIKCTFPLACKTEYDTTCTSLPPI